MKKKPEKPVNFEGLKVFVAEAEKWRKVLSPEFDITYKTSEMDNMAEVEFTLGTGVAEVAMSEKHTHDIGYEIRKSAFEEISHLAFSEITSMLDPYYSNDYIRMQEHKLINKYKSILIKK